ncbi:universal stress protein [Halocatena salina]|uniref:Universal stress protein n=1 Tax=Halocatena salina TaxID=2934340 RepID=A0A8U0A4L2_9EURY|nr:universal stress protein [Halocatena salina]UPM44145.1 universal stress protein [Halocatena salina]
MYDTILVPTDGSAVAEGAVNHALNLAEMYDADVHALYVIDTSAMDISLGTEQVDRIRQGQYDEMSEIQDRANQATGAVAEQAVQYGLEVTEAVAAGQPHDRIDGYAEDHGVDLIVMGSAGRGGVKRVLLGSVAERTLRTTTVPVLVVDVHEGED